MSTVPPAPQPTDAGLRAAPPMALFVLAALSPLPLFAAGLALGGVWALAGLVWMTLLAAAMDQIGGLFLGNAPEGAEFPGADILLVVIGVAALILLPVMVAGITLPGPPGTGARIALFLGTGLWLGQVAVPAAHELIHRGDRRLFRLGIAVYTALLFGHHASAHRLVHHVHAASPADPNSAPASEGYYRFAIRAWLGSFRRGLAAETALRSRAAGRGKGLNPYVIYCGGAVAVLLLAAGIGGWPGMLVWLGLGLHATSQILLSDYVQHYGLRRQPRPDGRLEPVSERHSWNAAPWFTGAMMLNAPRHSDHHAHPARPFPGLRLPAEDQAPRLPWSLPAAAVLALYPRGWKRAMRPHLARWQPAPPEDAASPPASPTSSPAPF